MNREELQQIQSLIDSLTHDEDLRQELWLLFLSGHNPSTFQSKLQNIVWEQRIADQVAIVAFHIMDSNKTLTGLIDFLSPIERSVLILVASGVSLDCISRYKGISHIRLRQILFSVQQSPDWIKLSKGTVYAQEETE